MTREEIISAWGFVEDGLPFDALESKDNRVDMHELIYSTIEALSAEPCDDAISRQAVLDVIEREMFKGDAISEIEKLPSVTPKQKMCFDGMTNGEVIKTLFPSCKTRRENTPMDNFMEFTLDGIVGYYIEKSWWNAPYKVESEDRDGN